VSPPVLYVGKTKDVLSLPHSGHLGFRFKDNILGRAGVPDSGGNEIVGRKAGKGRMACAIACRVFERLRAARIDTHFVDRLSDDSIMVLKAEPIRIEFISRELACGSYLRRHPEVPRLSPIPGTRELTLKDDARDDPLISEADAVGRGLISACELAAVRAILDRVTQALTDFFQSINLRLADFKLEVGHRPDLIVIDDLGYDNIRVFRGDHLLEIEELHRLVVG